MSNELRKEWFYLRIAFAISVLMGLFLVCFYVIDVKYNPVITFPDDVDPMNFQLTKDEYKRGEMVQGYTRFCKERESEGATKWTLHNGRLTFYTLGEYLSIPSGCYPIVVQDMEGVETITEGEIEYIIFDIRTVPIDADLEDTHYFSATNYQKLWGGRLAEQTFRTESFKVIE